MMRVDVHKGHAISAGEDPAAAVGHVTVDSSAASAKESTAVGA